MMKLTVAEVFNHPLIISSKSILHPRSSKLSIYHQKVTLKSIIQTICINYNKLKKA